MQHVGIFYSIMGPLAVSEYVYGALESKPIVLNLFKVLSVEISTLVQLTSSLTSFEEVKKIV